MKRYFYGTLLACVLGTAVHFLHDLVPIPLVGVIAPVRESIWEHLKLLLYPFLLGTLAVGRRDMRFWAAACLSALLMPLMLLGMYYLLLAGFGIDAPSVNMIIYYVTLLLGFAVLRHTSRRNWSDRMTGILIMLTSIWACALFVLSMYPPNLPIFQIR